MTTIRVGQIGLGAFGSRIAARLIRSGFTLDIYDVIDITARIFNNEVGGILTASPKTMARVCPVVITVLPTAAELREVVLGWEPLIDGFSPGGIIIDMGMTDPRETVDLAKDLAQRGIHLIDAPAIGTPDDAKAGRLKFIVGGDPDIVERCQPIFAALGAQVVHAGSVGAGQAATAISDYLRGVEMLAAAEAMRIGHSFGLNLPGLLRVGDEIGGLGPGIRAALQSEVVTERFESGLVLGQVLKNIVATSELAQRAGFDAQLLAACRRAWGQAEADIGSGADFTRIARWVATVTPVSTSGEREQAA